MRLIHTSDWHLGRSLINFRRYDEFEAFLSWLRQTIIGQSAEALIVAGDIFDTTSPSNRAQQLYYQFIGSLAGTSCRHIIIVAGNHDSPSFLDAPKEILRALNVHVVGTASDNADDEIIVLKDDAGKMLAVVCAVPYLRDRDIRSVEAGETIEQKGEKLLLGIREHYEKVCRKADLIRSETADIPLIATGHLFTAGGRTVEEDGVKELYVGNLAHASVEIFPETIDYFALGHLHIPQKVSGRDCVRYSGSPIAMGFGEAGQQKKVMLVDFDGRKPQVTELPVPCFRPLARVSGDMTAVLTGIAELKKLGTPVWLEVEYNGDALVPDLQEQVTEAVAGSEVDVVRVKNQRLVRSLLEVCASDENLDDLKETEIFNLCLDAHNIPDDQRPELDDAFREILAELVETDANKE